MNGTFIYEQLFVKPPKPTQDFSGKTIIVTGSNIGLGLEAARWFAKRNAAKVILACRSSTKGEQARANIEASLPPSKTRTVLEVWPLDLCSYASVQAFASRASTQLERLDVVVENAGIVSATFRRAEDDEATITVNVVSTFLLALLLLPKLRETATKFNVLPYLSIVSSEVHAWAKFNDWDTPNIFDLLNDEKKSDFADRYPISKLLEVLLVRAMVSHLSTTKPPIIINSVNPGLCHSSLTRDVPGLQGVFIWLLKLTLARTTEVGSRTLVLAANAGQASQGNYMSHGVVKDPSPFVQSERGAKAAEKLWGELLEKLEKVHPGIGQNV